MAQIAVNDKASRAPGILDRERTIAGPGFNRWLAPPAALAIHLCIGMAYGFSVFWFPISTTAFPKGSRNISGMRSFSVSNLERNSFRIAEGFSLL
jgi:hypothetical protein